MVPSRRFSHISGWLYDWITVEVAHSADFSEHIMTAMNGILVIAPHLWPLQTNNAVLHVFPMRPTRWCWMYGQCAR